MMMPNGAGKTTTLKLLRAVLDGSATNWAPHEVRSYRHSEYTGYDGQFTVRLLIDGQEYVVYLDLDYRAGKASHSTSSLESRGKVPDFTFHMKSGLSSNLSLLGALYLMEN